VFRYLLIIFLSLGMSSSTILADNAINTFCFDKEKFKDVEKSLYKNNNEVLLISGVNASGNYLQIYASSNSWTVFFLQDNNKFCTNDYLFGDIISISKLEKKNGNI